jgi:hypothetical protein
MSYPNLNQYHMSNAVPDPCSGLHTFPIQDSTTRFGHFRGQLRTNSLFLYASTLQANLKGARGGPRFVCTLLYLPFLRGPIFALFSQSKPFFFGYVLAPSVPVRARDYARPYIMPYYSRESIFSFSYPVLSKYSTLLALSARSTLSIQHSLSTHRANKPAIISARAPRISYMT